MNGTGNTMRLWLVGLLGIELLVIAGLYGLGPQRLPPPLPDMSGYNVYTAGKLQDLQAACDLHSAADWSQLSDAYIAHGFYPESEACARRAVELAPQDSELLVSWAFGLAAMGQIDKAIQNYHLALELGHAKPESVWYLIGRDHLRAERVDEARQALQQAEPLAAASYELAKLDYRAGQFQAALTRLQQIEQAYPNAHMCHWLRCQVETALGNSQVADDYRLLYALNRAPLPSPLDNFRDRYLIQLKRCALSNFVETQRSQIESGGVRQVQARLEELGKQGYEPQLEDLMANVELALGNQAQQIERLERIIEWDGASTYRCWRLATAYVQMGRDPEAIELLKMGLRLDGRDFVRESREALIELYEKAGDLGRARFHVSRLFGWEGSEALRETRMELAREKLSAAVQMDPSYADAWYDLGIVHGLFGQPDHQRHAFMQCLVANPQHGRAADWLEQHPDVR